MSERPLRILLVNRNCHPSIGGIQTFIDNLGRYLLRQGVDVSVAATLMPRDTQAGGLPYRVVYGPSMREAWRLLRWADIVHFNVFDYRWWLLAAASRKPVVFVYHSPSRLCPKGMAWNGREQCRFDTHWRQCPGCLKRGRSWPVALAMWCSLPIKRWLVDRSSVVVNVSQFNAAAGRVPRSVTIHYGSLLERFQPVENPTRDYVLFLGRLVPEKGCDVLVQAMQQCASQGHRIPLAIIGDGPEKEQLRALAHQLKVADRVTFYGTKTGAELVRWIQHARVMIIPSQWPEAWGMVAIEAMSCGVPVIAAASGGLQETAGIVGLTFPPGDARACADQIISLLKDEQLERRMRAEGPPFARQFSVERMGAGYLAAYRRLASTQPS